MGAITAIADEYWALLKRYEPYYAVMAGEKPETIEPVNEAAIATRAVEAGRLLGRLSACRAADDEADLVAVLGEMLRHDVDSVGQMWHVHLAAPYQTSNEIGVIARLVIAPLSGDERARLTGEFAARVRSVAERMRGQRGRGIALPRPAVAGARATWVGLRAELGELLTDGALDSAVDEVLAEVDAAEQVADAQVGLARLPGGEEIYRTWVRRETTQDVEPEALHRLGLEQCAELSERMAEVRSRLGGPSDEREARAWVQAQSHLYAGSTDEVAATYRRHIRRIEPGIGSMFRVLPQARYDVRRLDPSDEAGMTFGHYEPPTPDEPVGLYRFNGSNLAKRSQLTAAALILHELVPGHHFHVARQAENRMLHPLQRHTLRLGAFNEGWGEYASGLGWEMGGYADDWDAYGRLAHERFTAQRLVVDTALNLGWWNLDRARAFMRANTLDSDLQIATETLRYATDMPAQALAYRSGFLAFQQARASVPGGDVRDVHEAMLAGGAVPLPRMQQRVRCVASQG